MYDTFYDLLTLIVSSVYIIIKNHYLQKRDIKNILMLMNFFSYTDFTKNLFKLLGIKHSTFKNINDIYIFCKYLKKFNLLYSLPKYDLSCISPDVFISYIKSNGKCMNLNFEFSLPMIHYYTEFQNKEKIKQILNENYNNTEECGLKYMNVLKNMF